MYIYTYAYCSGPFDIIIIIIIILTDYEFSPQPTHVPTVCPNAVGGLCVCTYYIYNVLTSYPGSDLFIVTFFWSTVVENRFVCDQRHTFTHQYNVNVTCRRQLTVKAVRGWYEQIIKYKLSPRNIVLALIFFTIPISFTYIHYVRLGVRWMYI
jgi:hypothetical protein